MRLSVGLVIVLALLPIAFPVIGFYSAHIILSAPERVDWVSLGAPPGGAIEFVDQKGLVRGSDGRLFWPYGNEWILKSDHFRMAIREFDESCPPVVLPKGTVDIFQDCSWDSDDYYVIRNDGTVWYYTAGGDSYYKISRYVGEFIVKVIASVVGLAFAVGIFALVGILGGYITDDKKEALER